MPITGDAEATLLLTAHLSKQDGDAARPLTVREWSRLVKWLTKKKLTPADLMTGDLGEQLEGWIEKDISRHRIDALLQRKMALSLGLEKWERSGLWVMTRNEEDYPQRLRQKLAAESPPVLFGCGNRKLLADAGRRVAVVGSRKTTNENLEYSRDVGRLAAESGWLVVSGGAGGVDEAAMIGTLEAEGTVVGVLHSGLLQAARSAKYHSHLVNENLALVSPFYPEAGFDRGNAMSRNKLIYCLSTVAVVVHSDTVGGTWSGAIENLKHAWSPLWIKKDEEAMGNRAIAAQKGARWIDSLEDFREILAKSGSKETERGIFELFLTKAHTFCSEMPRTLEEMYKHFESEKIGKRQLKTWLTMAVKSGKIAKTSDSELYRWIADEQLPLAEKVEQSTESAQAPLESSVVQPQLSGEVAPASQMATKSGASKM